MFPIRFRKAKELQKKQQENPRKYKKDEQKFNQVLKPWKAVLVRHKDPHDSVVSEASWRLNRAIRLKPGRKVKVSFRTRVSYTTIPLAMETIRRDYGAHGNVYKTIPVTLWHLEWTYIPVLKLLTITLNPPPN